MARALLTETMLKDSYYEGTNAHFFDGAQKELCICAEEAP
jgi:hypothetical protein